MHAMSVYLCIAPYISSKFVEYPVFQHFNRAFQLVLLEGFIILYLTLDLFSDFVVYPLIRKRIIYTWILNIYHY